MRFILGIIVGCAITVGGAYVADAILPSAVAKPMVNWDVVDKDWQSFTHGVRNTWNKLASIR